MSHVVQHSIGVWPTCANHSQFSHSPHIVVGSKLRPVLQHTSRIRVWVLSVLLTKSSQKVMSWMDGVFRVLSQHNLPDMLHRCRDACKPLRTVESVWPLPTAKCASSLRFVPVVVHLSHIRCSLFSGYRSLPGNAQRWSMRHESVFAPVHKGFSAEAQVSWSSSSCSSRRTYLRSLWPCDIAGSGSCFYECACTNLLQP